MWNWWWSKRSKVSLFVVGDVQHILVDARKTAERIDVRLATIHVEARNRTTKI